MNLPRLIVAALAACLSMSLLQAPHAQTTDRIAAVVNEDIITQSELMARATLNARVLGVGETLAELPANQREALLRRTLGDLVDETLQRQYAASLGLALTARELAETKAQAMRNMGEENWQRLTRGFPAATERKVAAEATWARLQSAVVRSRVQLGTMEIDRLIEDMSRSRTREELNLSLIVLNEDSAASPAKLSALAERLATEASAGNEATFAELARTYSVADNATAGGAMGWGTQAELPPALAEAVIELEPGQVSAPQRVPDGILIVRLNDRRTQDLQIKVEPRLEVNLLVLAAPNPAANEARQQLARQLTNLTRQARTPEAATALLSDPSTTAIFNRSTALGWVAVESLQPDVRQAVSQTREGRWTDTLSAPSQLSRIFVLQTRRVMPPETLALRERIANNLMANRMQLEERKLMRELRQRAFIDIRL